MVFRVLCSLGSLGLGSLGCFYVCLRLFRVFSVFIVFKVFRVFGVFSVFRRGGVSGLRPPASRLRLPASDLRTPTSSAWPQESRDLRPSEGDGPLSKSIAKLFLTFTCTPRHNKKKIACRSSVRSTSPALRAEKMSVSFKMRRPFFRSCDTPLSFSINESAKKSGHRPWQSFFRSSRQNWPWWPRGSGHVTLICVRRLPSGDLARLRTDIFLCVSCVWNVENTCRSYDKIGDQVGNRVIRQKLASFLF